VGPKPRFLAAGLGAVWILNQGDGTVSRINPASNKVVATIALETPGNGGDIAIGAGAVWVTNLGTPLSRIDPATNQVTAQLSAPEEMRFASVWVRSGCAVLGFSKCGGSIRRKYSRKPNRDLACGEQAAPNSLFVGRRRGRSGSQGQK
jgi:YVTN family beta-propeller protein